MGQRLFGSALAGYQQEKLEFRAGVVIKPKLSGLVQHSHQHLAGVALELLAVGSEDLADHARRRVLAAFPGNDLEGRDVWFQVHVRFGDAGKALDRRSVEPGPMLDGIGELVDGNGDAFHRSGDVGELEIDEADVLIFGAAQNGFRGALGHGTFLSVRLAAGYPIIPVATG